MSSAMPFFGITLLCFGLHSGAAPYSDILKAESRCCCLVQDSEKTIHKRALKVYEEAFIRSFDEQWSKAAEASDCSGLLDHSSTQWAIDAKNFSEHHIH